MKSLIKKKSVYYSYIIVNFLWYMLIGMAGLFAVTIFTEHFLENMLMAIDLNIPISADQLELNSSVDPSMITIESARANLNTSYIIEHHYGLYINVLVSFALAFGMYMFGFYQLRMILKSAVNDFVFNKKNIKRLKIIAALLIVMKPFEFLVYMFIINPLGNLEGIQDLSYSVGFDGPGSFVFGLLLFALAAVFEKGHEMYQELKLTV